jgi:hypothetical protein
LKALSLPMLVLVLAALLPWLASAQENPQLLAHPAALAPRHANYAWDKELLRASFSYRDVLADPVLLQKLSNGLKMVIAMRAFIYTNGRDEPVALQVRSCEVAYDLWEEVYRVHVEEPEGKRDQPVLALEGVLRLCTEAQNLPLVRRGLLLTGRSYFLGVVVDVNPVSQEMREQMSRWLSRPTGSTSVAPTDALFGNFVELFVRQIATSDKTVTFRTQDVAP